jgi:hypothetical protein
MLVKYFKVEPICARKMEIFSGARFGVIFFKEKIEDDQNASQRMVSNSQS